VFRQLPFLLTLTIVFPNALQANEFEQAPTKDLSVLDDLDYLIDVPLPGESGPPPSRPKEADLGGFRGKIITNVTAVDPPSGYKPVDDADIPTGVPLDPSIVREAVIRLWDTGSYRNVRISARPDMDDGIELLIHIEPMLRIKRLQITGNQALDNDDIARAIVYKPDRTIVPDPEVLRTLRNKLLEIYAARGYRAARATLRIETTDRPGSVVLVVDIDEGKPDRYTQIKIPGLPDELYVDRMARNIGLKKKTVRDTARVEKAITKLTAELASAGYLDAKIKDYLERRIGRYKIEITIPVEAGIKTDVSFEGNAHFRSRELRKVMLVKGQMKTSPESVHQGLIRVTNHYQKNGFFHVALSPVRVCMNARGTSHAREIATPCDLDAIRQKIHVTILEGPTVEVVKILVKGNTFFTTRYLEEELYAFMREKEKQEDVFQPLTTETVDQLGLSDKRPDHLGRPRGAKAPRFGRGRHYVPKYYLEGVDHIVGIYQEKGFLDARATDACNLKNLSPRRIKNLRFSPFEVPLSETSQSEREEIGSPCVLIDEDQDQLVVVVTINEGVQTQLSEITFEGQTAFSGSKLQEITGLSRSDPYNEYRIREGAREIEKLYRSHGYMFVKANWESSFSADMRRARVSLEITEGPQARVGRIRVDGAETTSERLIRERLTLKPGDLITPKEIEKSQDRMTALGVLDSAIIQMVSPEIPSALKNLKVQVTEGKAQYLELRGGLATVDGIRGGFEYGYRNLGGWAINARFRVRANYRLFIIGNELFAAYYENLDSLIEKLEWHLLAGVGQPHFPGTRGLLGWDVTLIAKQENEPAYSARQLSPTLSLKSAHGIGDKYRHAIVLELRNGVEINNIRVLALEALEANESPSYSTDPVYEKYLRMPQGESTFWVTGIGVTLDFRNHPFNPSKGLYVSVNGDYVLSIENALQDEAKTIADGDVDATSNLIRAQATISGYVPFGDSGLVLALSGTFGYIFHLSKDSITWADRYFYIGSVETLRGFSEDSLIPEDSYQYWKSTLNNASDETNGLLISPGGQSIFLLRSELRIPLPMSFTGTVFGEIGNIWRNQAEIANMIEFQPLKINLRPVVGLGLHYMTPIGPLSFDLGINCNRRPHEVPLAWYFSIGSAF
jgi:outer membrane protein assembly factor BamA